MLPRKNDHHFENASLDVIKNELWPLFVNEQIDPHARPADFMQRLYSAATRLQDFDTDEMRKDCQRFQQYALFVHMDHDFAGREGENYLQLLANVHSRLGNHEQAADAAALLGNVYFINHHVETDAQAGYYNRLAGQAYRRMGDHENAAHHFNQYLTVNCYHGYGDVLDIVGYLVEKKLPLNDKREIVQTINRLIEGMSIPGLEEKIRQLPPNELRAALHVYGIPHIDLLSGIKEKLTQLKSAVVGSLAPKHFNHEVFKALANEIQDATQKAPLNTGGVFAGEKPRPIRELNQVLNDIRENRVDIRDGVTKICHIAERMGVNHPIYLAALECQSHLGYVELRQAAGRPNV